MERSLAHPAQTHSTEPEPSRTDRMEALRRLYARQIAALAGIDAGTALGSGIVAALATIPREKFVAPPPWRIVSPRGRAVSSEDDPAALYQDILAPLGVGQGLNNGQPSLHALCFQVLAPRTGESVVHVGAGTGYYTAMLAMLVGETGRVDAYEIEPELAQRAAANLAGFPQVAVHNRSGALAPLPDCDLLYVNAAAVEPLAVWLDALRPQGRLLFPLQSPGDIGGLLLVTRSAEVSYPARFLCGVQFVSCSGAQDAQAARALEAAFARGNWAQVRRLVRNDQPDENCWCAGRGWWLSTR